MSYQEVEFSRDCPAVQIPQGNTVQVSAGTPAFITQSLGGSYTLQVPSLGGLFRVAGSDADAIGMDSEATQEVAADALGAVTEDAVWDMLKGVYDPEIPVNIVDLGLVYDMRISDAGSGYSRVEVKMTLTAPGCGMGGPISMDAKQRIETLRGVSEAIVDVVWDPPWSPQMISEEGRSKLGME